MSELEPTLQRAEGTGIAQAAYGGVAIVIQDGPHSEQIEALSLDLAEIKSLLLHGPYSIPQMKSPDPVAAALFACESDNASTLGFAVNNSGLLICPSIGPISRVRQLVSGVVSEAEVIQTRNLLQAVKAKGATLGLIPSYMWHDVCVGDELFVLNRDGKRCKLVVFGLMMWLHVNRRQPLPAIVIKDVFIGRCSHSQEIIGGPVINAANEVVGIAVARFTENNEVIVKPWSALENCIEMQVEEARTQLQQGGRE
jgi:hypothetical protein